MVEALPMHAVARRLLERGRIGPTRHLRKHACHTCVRMGGWVVVVVPLLCVWISVLFSKVLLYVFMI